MIIELRGVGFVNKGAELMLVSILEKVRERYPHVLFVMGPAQGSTRQKLREYDIFHSTDFRRFRTEFKNLFGYVPGSLRRRLRYITPKEVDVVLDASGFAYGDTWGAQYVKSLLTSHISEWKEEGKTVILLPQAFGPFTDRELIVEMKRALAHADLIFARDRVSFEYLAGLGASNDKIKVRPDFTNLISGETPSDFLEAPGQVAIIPNSKMVEKVADSEGGAYIRLVELLIEKIRARGGVPLVLLHEEGEGDVRIADRIAERFDGIPIIREPNPLFVKGIIGKCDAVVTSRFHGLVSALSQGIPCLCTSWSHKYEMLLKDYAYPEAMVDVNLPESEVESKIDLILEPASNSTLRSRLSTEARKQKELSNNMWREVFALIDRRTTQ